MFSFSFGCLVLKRDHADINVLICLWHHGIRHFSPGENAAFLFWFFSWVLYNDQGHNDFINCWGFVFQNLGKGYSVQPGIILSFRWQRTVESFIYLWNNVQQKSWVWFLCQWFKGHSDGSELYLCLPQLQVFYIKIGMNLAIFDGNQNRKEYFIFSLCLDDFFAANI